MRSIRIEAVGVALACLWCTASGLQAAIIKVEYDFSTYPAVPFSLEGGISRTYLYSPTGTQVGFNNPATISPYAMYAQMQYPPGPYVPWGNPVAWLDGRFHAAVIGYQIVWTARLTAQPMLQQATGSAWTFAEVAPLLDFEGTNHFAAEGNYITRFSVQEYGTSFGLTGLKLYIDTSVNVPDGSPRIVFPVVLGALLLVGRLVAERRRVRVTVGQCSMARQGRVRGTGEPSGCEPGIFWP